MNRDQKNTFLRIIDSLHKQITDETIREKNLEALASCTLSNDSRYSSKTNSKNKQLLMFVSGDGRTVKSFLICAVEAYVNAVFNKK